MKKIITVLGIAFLGVALVHAGSVDAMPFLRMGVSARAMGMGSAFAGVSDDLAAAYYNPAGIASLEGSKVSLMTAMLSNSRSMQWLSYGMPLGNGALAFSALSAGVSDIPGATLSAGIPSLTGDSFDSSDMSLAATYAKKYDKASAGMNLKYLSSSIDNNSAAGFGFDAGMNFKPAEKLSVGVVLQDIASSRKWDTDNDTKENIPTVAKLGAAYAVLDGDMTLAVDISKISDEDGNQINAGAEYKLSGNLAARVGVDDGNFAAGFGIGMGALSLNYALRFEDVENNANRQYISLDYAFASSGSSAPRAGEKARAREAEKSADRLKAQEKAEKKANQERMQAEKKAEKERLKDEEKAAQTKAKMKEHYNKATELYAAGKYKKAIKEWEKVLEIDPKHQQSKTSIAKARQKLEE
ncbi:MAG: PorV/PorQ family protein [Candidatus Omnitrophota bacterium]|nr:PorV/PorQ family protein [bacterium]MBU3930457.1 PorV/PorQ family protein [bacterium]